MWNETNPINLYLGTTWELLTAGKYIQTGSTPLSTGGSNSVSIVKANLPNIKLKVDSFSLTISPHSHTIPTEGSWSGSNHISSGNGRANNNKLTRNSGGGQNTGTASPSTEVLGSGTALTIKPAYITLKFWKRLT